MRNLSKDDCKNYLKNGVLSKPFLDSKFVFQKIMNDYEHKIQIHKNYTKLQSIYNWIHNNVTFSKDNNFKAINRFQRNAKEIWESKLTASCTDYAILFATFARQLNIPTSILHTAEKNWLKSLKSGETSLHLGHSFCECYYNGKWMLVDPTNKKLLTNYNSEELILPYKVGPGNIYIQYYRGLDLEKRQDTTTHNLWMDNLCKNLTVK